MKRSGKNGFILIESLISMLLITTIGVSAMYIVSGYYKQTFARDTQLKEVIQNINTIENLKAGVHTLSQLCDFAGDNAVRIIAVGVGEVSLTQKLDGGIEVEQVSDENYGFSERLQSENTLFRIEVGGETPNTKLITVLRLEDE